MPHIVLASKSPRRHELLRRMGITDFSVVVPDVEETYPEGLTPQEIVAHIARLTPDKSLVFQFHTSFIHAKKRTRRKWVWDPSYMCALCALIGLSWRLPQPG